MMSFSLTSIRRSIRTILLSVNFCTSPSPVLISSSETPSDLERFIFSLASLRIFLTAILPFSASSLTFLTKSLRRSSVSGGTFTDLNQACTG